MSNYDPETVKIEVKRLPEGLRGIIFIEEKELRKLICRRVRPCVWEVVEEYIAGTKNSNLKSLDAVMVGALEEEYQHFLHTDR